MREVISFSVAVLAGLTTLVVLYPKPTTRLRYKRESSHLIVIAYGYSVMWSIIIYNIIMAIIPEMP